MNTALLRLARILCPQFVLPTSANSSRSTRAGRCSPGRAWWLAAALVCAAPLAGWSLQVQADWERAFIGSSPQIYALTRAEGTNAYAIKTDAEGNVYVGTTTQRGAGIFDADMLLLKYNCKGTLIWSRTFNSGPGLNDYLSSIDLDAAGNIFITGFSETTTGFGAPRRWMTLRYSPAGVISWGPNIYGTAHGLTIPRAIAIDGFGDVVVSGIDMVAGTPRISMVKYCGQNGGLLGSAAATTVPGPASMVHPQFQSGGTPMALDRFGNAIVAGWIDQPSSVAQCLTVKFKCESISACNYGGTFLYDALLHAGSGQQLGYAVALNQNTSPQMIYVLGFDRLNNRWTVVSYRDNPSVSISLNTTWGGSGVVNYNFPGSTANDPSAIAVAANGQVVATGATTVSGRSDYLTVKWNANGIIPGVWPPIRTSTPAFFFAYDGLKATAVKLDAAGNVYVTGAGHSLVNGTTDFLTIRYGLAPLPLTPEDWWVIRNYPNVGSTTYHDKGVAMTLDASGHVYVTGPSLQVSGAAPTRADTVKYCQGPPANDTCATAPFVSSGTTAFSTCFANSTSPTVSPCGADNQDVWFRWRAPCNGLVDMDTFGSCFDTVLTVYDAGVAGTCATLGAVQICDDNALAGRPAGTPQSYGTFSAIAGHVYYIQIGGGTGASGPTGDGRLTIFGPYPPVGTCPSSGTWGPWRVFKLTGSGNGSNWRWSIAAPCCMNLQGTAFGPIAGSSPSTLATVFAASINAACPGMAVAMGNTLAVRAQCAGPFDFRVGQATTPFNALCLVPNLSPGGLTTATTPGVCRFNPEIEEQPDPLPDCNGNGVPDHIDIDLGTSLDLNENGIPDECDSPVVQTITNSVVAGYNLIAVPLVSSNNLLGTVLPGAQDGDQVFRWNVVTQDFVDSDVYVAGLGWIDAFTGDPSATTISPGEGAFYLTSVGRTWSFTGTPIQSTLPIFATPGSLTLASRQVPGTGSWENITGLPQEPGSQLIRFDPLTQDYVSNSFNGNVWSGGAPSVNSGESAFILRALSSLLSFDCVSNKTVFSSNSWSFDLPTATTTCPLSNVVITVQSTVTNSYCPLILTRTWQATDGCSNSAICSQMVTVINTTPLDIHCPSNIVVSTTGSNVVVNFTPTYSGGTFSGCVPPSGYAFPVGTTTVTCYIDNGCTTNACTFSVTVNGSGPPDITQPPVSQVATQGQFVSFEVLVAGAGPLTFQWHFNGQRILEAQDDRILTIANVQPANFGSYFVVVSNSLGTVTSAVATLAVIANPVATPECCGVKPTFSGVPPPATYAGFAGQIAAVTSFSFDLNAPVLSIFDVQNSAAPVNVNYPAPVFTGPASAPWTKARLGNIFGLCFDGAGNIYVAASAIYNETPDTAGPGGLGAVYKIDGVTGVITTFAVLPNAGKASLGNIKYSCQHANFYVSNLGDGLIYRLDLNGNIIGTFDHGAGLPTAAPPFPAILDNPVDAYTQLGRRVFGLKPHNGRLYYGVWWEHNGAPDPLHDNEIWSVALNSSGAPIAGTQAREIIQPPKAVGGNYSNPCSDISFSPAGQMLFAERTLTSDSLSWAHGSRIVEASGCCGAWSLNLTKYFANPCFGPSSAGGVDYDRSAGGRVWATGDALHFIGCAGHSDYIYGIFGLPLAGGNTLNSVLINVDGLTGVGNKTQIGDVELPCPPPRCLVVTNEVLNCISNNGTYSYKFCATNFFNGPISHITLLDPPPGVTFTPDIINLATPLLPGQGNCFEVTVRYTGTGPTNVCFRFGAHNSNFVQCCASPHCVVLPDCCAYIYNESLTPIPGQGGCYNYTFTVRNVVWPPTPIQYLILVSDPPNTCFSITPDVLYFSTPLLPNQSATRTVKVCSTANPPCPQPFCFQFSLHDTNFLRCCATRRCAPKAKGPIKFADGLDGSAYLAGANISLPVVVDASFVEPALVTAYEGSNVLRTIVDPTDGQHDDWFVLSNAVSGAYTLRLQETDTLGGEWEADPITVFVYGVIEPLPDPVNSGPRFLTPTLLDGKVSLSLATELGVTYRIEYTESLTVPNWQTLHTLLGDGSVMSRTDPLVNGPQRFYRIRTP